MRWVRINLALRLALAGGLTLLSGVAWAWGERTARSVVVIDPPAPVTTNRAVLDHRSARSYVQTEIIVITTVIVVNQVQTSVWVPPHWHWNGFGWVVVGGHWASAW